MPFQQQKILKLTLYLNATRIRFVKRQTDETALEGLQLHQKRKLEVEIFNCLLDTTLVLLKERSEWLPSILVFLVRYKKV